MENYKKYCLCGSTFEKTVPIKHNSSKKHQNWALKNPTVTVTQKYKCVCDSVISESGLKTHLNTEKHKNYINSQKKEGNLIDFSSSVSSSVSSFVSQRETEKREKEKREKEENEKNKRREEEKLFMSYKLPEIPPIKPTAYAHSFSQRENEKSYKSASLPNVEKKEVPPKKNVLPTDLFPVNDELDRKTLKELESFLDDQLRPSVRSAASEITCDCGSVILKTYLKKHLSTKKHKDWEMKKK